MKHIVFAFALSNENIFTDSFFGDSDKFAIYEFTKGGLKFVEEIPNILKVDNNGNLIHINDKREKIVSLLSDKNVSVMVSRQYSQYLRKVSDEFIPVLIEKEKPEQVVEILDKNIKWIKDELKNRKSNFMLFKINKGTLKLDIK